VITKYGGPAFPTFEMVTVYSESKQQHVEQPYALSGMSLRDYFAAKALAGCMAQSATSPHTPDTWARVCYQMADAMLAERAK
jgi:hypothetical protein